MLQMTNGAIVEQNQRVDVTYTDGTAASGTAGNVTPFTNGIGQTGYLHDYWWQTGPIYWNSYPVYVCSDKTKKAIEVLKALQAEKLLKCESVPRFIELVEKISGLL